MESPMILFKAAVLMISLCMLLTACSTFPDNTLFDDEDTVFEQEGEFSIKLLGSDISCNDWKEAAGMDKLSNNILEHLVRAVSQSCQCALTKQHIVNSYRECSNALLLNGDLRFIEDPSTLSMPQILTAMQEWGLTNHTFSANITSVSSSTMRVSFTIIGVSTLFTDATGSGSGSGGGSHDDTQPPDMTTSTQLSIDVSAGVDVEGLLNTALSVVPISVSGILLLMFFSILLTL